ncbi:hypothetical protein [Psychroflexus planctonicus]|uniref:hypothetical protein n=1 Tax=Psychroflexus planctonicus TaxID=1526575 RepID=UPI001666EA4D|nr:hypothetical protein [Psychroflexus planctonicus]
MKSKKFEKTNTINEKSELFLGDKYYGISRGDIKEWVWREWSQSNSSKDNKPLFFDNFGNTKKWILIKIFY